MHNYYYSIKIDANFAEFVHTCIFTYDIIELKYCYFKNYFYCKNYLLKTKYKTKLSFKLINNIFSC